MEDSGMKHLMTPIAYFYAETETTALHKMLYFHLEKYLLVW